VEVTLDLLVKAVGLHNLVIFLVEPIDVEALLPADLQSGADVLALRHAIDEDSRFASLGAQSGKNQSRVEAAR
jgi:hypothetical protein